MRDGALSPEGLGHLRDTLRRHIDAGVAPGVVYLVARGDDVHVETIGQLSFTDPAAMGRSGIFRIASLTKPVTAVTTLSLVEDGILRLDDAIDELIPELADRRVLRSIDAELDDTVPARRSITVNDLLTFRTGIGSVMAAPGSTPIQRAEDALCLRSIGGPPWPPVSYDVDGWIAALGSLPLVAHPGERWLYNTSAQILGVLIARATGLDLETVMRQRVLDPLGMHGTGFTVPAGRLARFTTAYGTAPETGDRIVLDEPGSSWWGRPPSFPDASGMLVSTIDDYWTFVSMILAGGTGNGAKILAESTVDTMTTEQITAEQREAAAPFLGGSNSWGLGFGAPAAGATEPVPTGIGWEGGSGTTWRSDLLTGVTGILFTQRAMDSPVAPVIYDDFWAGVRAAAV